MPGKCPGGSPSTVGIVRRDPRPIPNRLVFGVRNTSHPVSSIHIQSRASLLTCSPPCQRPLGESPKTLLRSRWLSSSGASSLIGLVMIPLDLERGRVLLAGADGNTNGS